MNDIHAATASMMGSLAIEQRRHASNPGSWGQALALRHRDLAMLLAIDAPTDPEGRVAVQANLAIAIDLMRGVAEYTGDSCGLGRTIMLRADVDAGQGRATDALRGYREAEHVLAPLGAHRYLLDIYEHTTDTLLALGEVDDAVEQLQKAVIVAAQLDQDHTVTRLRHRIHELTSPDTGHTIDQKALRARDGSVTGPPSSSPPSAGATPAGTAGPD
jgi:hypothetical protein